MSEEHKSALAAGRSEGAAVRRYLEALGNRQHRRDRPRKAASERLVAVENELAGADPLRRLLLLQERRTLTAQMEQAEVESDAQELEDGFVQVAASYARRKGIDYATWREAGVPAAVLRRAGIARRREA